MQIGNKTYSRKSPISFFERGGIPLGWVVVRHSHVDTVRDRRKSYGRWVSITCGKHRIFRVLRYSVNLPANQIVIDWGGWIDLQGRTDKESTSLNLQITTARWWQFFTIPFRHVDPAYRLSAWLGAISILLGILSLFLTRPWELFWPRAQPAPIETHVSITLGKDADGLSSNTALKQTNREGPSRHGVNP